jgi:Acetyltransferase (GNAT) domain
VAGEYDFIMPLPKRRKFGLAYIYVPTFAGQLGIIGSQAISRELTDSFILSIPASFLIADLILNEGNPNPSLTDIEITQRTNYILPLSDDYPVLCARYSEDAKKNLRRTRALGLLPCPDIPVDTIIRLYRAAYGDRHPQVSATAYQSLADLFRHCVRKDNGFTLGITDPAGQLLAAAFFGMDNKRIYYILGAPTPQGRAANAVHSLIDEVIKKYAGTGIIFDFEGSDIPGVAAFYRKFNPQTEYYGQIRLSRVPGWIQRLPLFFPRQRDPEP